MNESQDAGYTKNGKWIRDKKKQLKAGSGKKIIWKKNNLILN